MTAQAQASTDVADPSDVKRLMNRMIRRSLHPGDVERVAFLCECGDATCYSPIWLTSNEYDRAMSWTSERHLARRHSAPAALAEAK